MTVIKPINGYHRIMVKLDNDLRQEYLDEEGNLCFKSFPLEEIHLLDNIQLSSNKIEEENFLIKRIRELETKLTLNDELKLNQVGKQFVLEKFDKKQDAAQWMEQFGAECARHAVTDDIKLIEILRFFSRKIGMRRI